MRTMLACWPQSSSQTLNFKRTHEQSGLQNCGLHFYLFLKYNMFITWYFCSYLKLVTANVSAFFFFNSNVLSCRHYCVLYDMVFCPTFRLNSINFFMYKVLLGDLFSCLCKFCVKLNAFVSLGEFKPLTK